MSDKASSDAGNEARDAEEQRASARSKGKGKEVANDAGDGSDDDSRADSGGGDSSVNGGGDKDSDALSEIDENQFGDYDPATANIDEDMAKSLKAAKRKPAAGAGAPKKRLEVRRQKKRPREDDASGAVDGAGTGDPEARRPRKARKAAAAEKSPAALQAATAAAAAVERERWKNLSPLEKRKLLVAQAMHEAEHGGSGRRRKTKQGEIASHHRPDLENQVDESIASLKIMMEQACEADNQARDAGKPGVLKLRLLPAVVSVLSRQNLQDAVLDPDTNFLQHVKFFLEPLNDGSLPAFNVQRDIFRALTKLPIEKEALLSSGIGKVVLFYTRSKQPTVEVKRMAERLLGEWSRPILRRTDDFRKRHVETRQYDYDAAKQAQREAALNSFPLAQRPAKSARELERERLLAPPVVNTNRARIPSLPESYTIAPQSTFDPSKAPQYRPGANGMEAFRKLAQAARKRGV